MTPKPCTMPEEIQVCRSSPHIFHVLKLPSTVREKFTQDYPQAKYIRADLVERKGE